MIGDYNDGAEYCRQVIDTFGVKVLTLYSSADIENRFIISQNRQGMTEKFPLASISIADISNREKRYGSIEDFSKDIAVVKKKCKLQVGSCFEIL